MCAAFTNHRFCLAGMLDVLTSWPRFPAPLEYVGLDMSNNEIE